MRVAEVVDVLAAQGFGFRGRPTQAVSDALRSEVRHGRVAKVDWGWFAYAGATDRHVRYARESLRELVRDHGRDRAA